jgi:hypothetical protein
MQKFSTYFSLFAVLFFIASGCGKKEKTPEELAQENAQKMAQEMQKTGEQMQKAGEQMQKSLYGDHKPVAPVSFKVLMGYLPVTISGMTAEKPHGETTTMGEWNFSVARNRYADNGSQSVQVEISDFAYIGMLYAPYQLMMNMNFKHESSDGYERTTKIAGFPAYEKWDEGSKNHEVSILTGERFLVHVECNNMPDGSAKKIAETINIAKLAGEK